ncbi:MAG: methyltransferase domain-containing protein [Rhodothalassiaceae bacterium]
MPEPAANRNARGLVVLAAAIAVVIVLVLVTRPGSSPQEATPTATRQADPIAAAIADPSRPEDEQARDAGRKPARILAFYGVTPGMHIYEIAAGSGYYTRLLSHVAGPEGHIVAHSSERFWPRLKDRVEPLYAALGNVEPFIGDPADYAGEPESMDAVFVVLIWHHMHHDPDAGEVLPARTVRFLDTARRLLKPGGVLAIIEHEAADGTTRAESAGWHRAPKRMTIDDVTAHGFELVAESDALANPDDDLRNYWREALPQRDSSQRFVLKFVKPAA